MSELRRTIERVRAEFLEMPGLRLTAAQAQRLCGVDETMCRGVLDALTDVRFLQVNRDGTYARATDGYLPPLRPVTTDDLACAGRAHVPVLLTGGTAVMRLAVACEIHEVSGLIGQPFVYAGHGTALTAAMAPCTIYFEEIARLAAAEQQALCGWLEHRPARVRLISATGMNPVEAVAAGRLDPTLFYRLNVVHICLM